MAIPVNRGFVALRRASNAAPLPSRIQTEDFGTSAANTATTGRPPAPRPALTTSTAQAKEVFTAEKIADPQSVARALNALQTKIAESTAQARANPFANGQLFQNVPVSTTIVIDHGFGVFVVGVIITNARRASITSSPRLVLYEDDRDNNSARIELTFTGLSASPTADFYLFR